MGEVINDLLGRPGLKIVQDYDMFNFSLDSIILANFVSIKTKDKLICDLGTGNAPIPLYLSLNTDADIVGFEIQKKSYELAQKSVKMNLKDNQIRIINDDMKNAPKILGEGSCDVVISNPPFFKYIEGKSNVNKNDEKTIARHEVLITLDEIINVASKLLKNGGTFAMVHRPDRLIDIIESLRKYHLEPKRLRLVYPKENTEANHILIEARKDGLSGGLKILPPLIIHTNDNKHTEEVRKIYNNEKEWFICSWAY